MSASENTSGNSLVKIIVLVTIFVAVMIAFLAAIGGVKNIDVSSSTSSVELTTESLTANEARIIEIVSGHAWQNHGDEVNKAIKCLGDNGTYKSFRTSGFTDDSGKKVDASLWLCFDGNDYYAVVTTKFLRNGGNQIARLITAYRVAKDIFPTIDDFVNYIAIKWSAFEINYSIKAGENIFLSPK